jgi:hypothetical protein
MPRRSPQFVQKPLVAFLLAVVACLGQDAAALTSLAHSR